MECIYFNKKCKCEILNKMDCKNCKFKKTETQLAADQLKLLDYMEKYNLERVTEEGKVKFKRKR